MQKKQIFIRGMHCKSCEMLTEEELGNIPGVIKTKTNFRTGSAEIFYQDTEPDSAFIEAAVRRAGYALGVERQPWFSQDISQWVEALFAGGIVFVLFVLAQWFGLFNLSLGANSTENFSSLPFVLLLGIVAGLSTCMAIVGGMVLAVSARFSELHPEASIRQKFLPNVYFNLGRIGGFAVFGGVLGALGSTFQLSSFSIGTLTILVGVVMVLIGIQLLELFPRLSSWKLMLPKGIAKVLGIQSHTKKEYSHSRAMLLGAATFFLPCGFTQAVQLFVVTQGSPFVGAITMGTFALGTAPGLLGIGGISAAAKGGFRRFFFKVAGIVVIALGLFNFENGLALVKLGSTASSIVSGEGSNGSSKEVQVVRITQKVNGYFPNRITVKKGEPVRLIVDSEESYSCAASFTVPKAGIRKTLKPGENVFEFTPKESGDIPFSCSMGMYRGVIEVVE